MAINFNNNCYQLVSIISGEARTDGTETFVHHTLSFP